MDDVSLVSWFLLGAFLSNMLAVQHRGKRYRVQGCPGRYRMLVLM